MALDSQGNTILVGNFDGTCDFSPRSGTMNIPSTGPYDGFVAKYDPNGALLQSASLAGGKPASSPVHPVTSPLTGSVGPAPPRFITTHPLRMRNSFGLISALLLAQALHAQYTIDWSHPAADTYKNGVMAARDTSDNVVVVGTRPSYLGAAHIFTQKYDKDGILLWERVDSTGIQWLWETPTWVTTSSTNDIYVTGNMYTGTTDIYTDSVIVLKYDQLGNLHWRRTIGPAFIFGVHTRCAADANGDLYLAVAGLQPSGFHLIKYDPNGNETFHVMETSPIAINLTSMRLKDDRLVLVGTGIGAVHGAVASWDTSGNFLWSHLVAGYGAQDVEVDDALNTYVLTSFPDLIAPLSGRDVVIKQFDAAGDSTTQFVYDFNGTDQPSRMTLVNGRITVIGWTVPQAGGYMDWTTFQTDLSGSMLWNATYNAMLSNDEIPGWVAARDNGDVYVTGKGGPLYQGQYRQYVTLKYSNGVQEWVHTDPYFGYEGVACVLGKDSALYVLGYGSMTVTRYIDDLSTGLADVSEARVIQPFPVPATDHLIVPISAHHPPDLGFDIHDVSGRTIMSGTLNDASSVLDVSGFTNGTYLLRTSDGGAVRFVVQH